MQLFRHLKKNISVVLVPILVGLQELSELIHGVFGTNTGNRKFRIAQYAFFCHFFGICRKFWHLRTACKFPAFEQSLQIKKIAGMMLSIETTYPKLGF